MNQSRPARPEDRGAPDATIGHLTPAERVKLALTGPRPARDVLLRDPNPEIRGMVLRNPGISEEEILELARNPLTDEALLREIAADREWVDIYPVRLALVENPRTPVGEAVRLLRTLGHHQLRLLAHSRNVPEAVALEARRILERKERMTECFSVRRLIGGRPPSERAGASGLRRRG